MIRSTFIKVIFGFGLLQGALIASACSSGSQAEAPANTGTFNLPLLASVGAHTYRLQGGLYVYGSVFQSIDISPDANVIAATLPTGTYTANLYTWSLTRDDGSGNFVPVAATLTSSSAPSFSIFNQTTTTVSFQFATDGQIVTIGAGQLNVAIDVHESTLVCTPLGDDCPANSWCAPTELTGAALSCIPAGPVAEGGPCGAPADCAANSSCFDRGAGSVCLELCSKAEFNQPCSSGARCTPQGTDYGVCLPSEGDGGAAGAPGAP